MSEKLWYVTKIKRLFFSKKERTIEIDLPIGFMNCGVSTCNHFIADTNNSTNWDTLKFPLPKPRFKWHIKCYTSANYNANKRRVILIDKWER